MKRLIKIGMISILLLGIVMVSQPRTLVFAQGEPTISVINSQTGGNDFTFYTNTTFVGSRFNATVSINNGTNIASWQVRMDYNYTILNATLATIPSNDPDYILYGESTFTPQPVFTTGSVLVGDLTVPPSGVTFNTPKLMTIIEFEVLEIPPAGEGNFFTDVLNINFIDVTYILDPVATKLPAVRVNGNYELNWVKPASQISLSATPSTVNIGSNVVLSGSITAPSDASATFPDVSVTIWHRVGTTATFTNLTAVTTNSSSGYSYTWTSADPGTHQFQSSWLGNTMFDHASSAIANVTVNKIAVSITLDVNPTTVKVGENMTLSGQITPVLSGVDIKLLSGTTLITTVTTTSTGSFSYLYAPEHAGSFELKATYDGDSTHASAESAKTTVTIESAPTEVPWLYYAIAAIVIIIIIVVVVYLLRRRSQ